MREEKKDRNERDREGGQRFNGILCGRFNGVRAVQWNLEFPVDVCI